MFVILSVLVPVGQLMPASADKRCTPIAHVVDASQIPGNESQNPNGHPDQQYEDGLGLNCIPTYELDFAGAIDNPAFPKGSCDPESAYDVAARAISEDPAWDSKCRRLKFTMGPLMARPGMNDTMIHVTALEKPGYDGYTLRWKPGLQNADGTVPPVENLHLHHGTWIGGVNGPTAATGPFFATGEEQTILSFPKGYGWSWQGDSAWIMIYMLHNALPTAQPVYITYDIDYIATADAEALGGIKDTKSLWLDVGGSGGNAITTQGNTVGMNYYSAFNPIFNAQRGFGHDDTGAFWGLTTAEGSTFETKPVQNNFGSGKRVCYWPRENCSVFNSAQAITPQQGAPRTDIVGNRTNIPESAFGGVGCAEGSSGGTLVNMGGHLHPGGLRDEVSLKRGNRIVPIHISDAVYWDHDQPVNGGGPATSWDLSMTGTLSHSAGLRENDAWKIAIQPGDQFILNGVYDTTVASTYDQMGIVMSWVNPGCDPDAIDPFAEDVILDAGWATGPNIPARAEGIPAEIDNSCTPGTIRPGDPDAGLNGENVGKTVLCLRGNVTHGSMESRQNHADCGQACQPLAPTTKYALPTHSCSTEINGTSVGDCLTISMQGFTYGPFDAGAAQIAMPQVAAGTTMTFVNPDTAGMVWHSVTRCLEPCTGATSANYPLADGGTMEENLADVGRPRAEWQSMDFDSAVLCAGLGCATEPVTSWSFKPSRTGTYTFWCRIHPFMRGAFEVTAS